MKEKHLPGIAIVISILALYLYSLYQDRGSQLNEVCDNLRPVQVPMEISEIETDMKGTTKIRLDKEKIIKKAKDARTVEGLYIIELEDALQLTRIKAGCFDHLEP
jgi:hypothetical protein